MKRKRWLMQVKFQGAPMTLEGHRIELGEKAPDFLAVNNNLETITAADFTGKRVYLSVPSLDTPVCDMEVRRFNEEAVNFKGAKVYVVSMDLPFAQARWCGAQGIENVTTLSDYKDHSFGHNFGVHIKELGLLTRAVFVMDEEGSVVYCEYCDEITAEPNYEAAIKALG